MPPTLETRYIAATGRPICSSFHPNRAFQGAYAIGLLGMGRFIDRVGTRLGYSLALGWWSIAAMMHGLASSALGFGWARFLLGLGQAGNYPAAIKTVAEWFPKRERGDDQPILRLRPADLLLQGGRQDAQDLPVCIIHSRGDEQQRANSPTEVAGRRSVFFRHRPGGVACGTGHSVSLERS
jgi:hypothetical protein